MKNKKGVVRVLAEHISLGIVKYGGVLDEHIAKLIKNEGLSYTPYRFKDGRVLLVMPNNTVAFLYDNEDLMFDALGLE